MPTLDDAHAAFGKAADQRGFEHRRMGAPVTPHGDGPRAFAMRLGGKGPAKRISVGLGQRVADDPADVIFAKDGGVRVCAPRPLPVIASEAKQSRKKIGTEGTKKRGSHEEGCDSFVP